MGSIHSTVTANEGMIDALGRKVRGGMRFHHAAQNGVRFKTYDLFISGIFHLMYSDGN